jgi:hypothetical protein
MYLLPDMGQAVYIAPVLLPWVTTMKMIFEILGTKPDGMASIS